MCMCNGKGRLINDQPPPRLNKVGVIVFSLDHELPHLALLFLLTGLTESPQEYCHELKYRNYIKKIKYHTRKPRKHTDDYV